MLPILLAAAAFASEGLSLGVPLEYDVIGGNIGVRPELLWRPTAPDSALNLRAAVGLLPGPEYFYLPISAGARFVPGRKKAWPVRPVLGAGVEAENFLTTDHAPVFRVGFFAELGAEYIVGANSFGLMAAPELSIFNRPGAGLSTRLTWTRDL